MKLGFLVDYRELKSDEAGVVRFIISTNELSEHELELLRSTSAVPRVEFQIDGYVYGRLQVIK
jgi:hypothetical protein